MKEGLSLRDPLARVRGLGSAKSGVAHWWVQRLTAMTLLPLTIWFVFIVLSGLHSDYAAAQAIVAQPLNALLLITFVIALFWHAQLGLQVVIEDYVHTHWLELALQIKVKIICGFLALAAVLAVVRIALGH